MEDAVDKGHSGIHAKIAVPDFNALVSVDMRVLESGRLCWPGQYSLGGAFDSTFPHAAIWLKPMLRMALVSLRTVDVIVSALVSKIST